MIWCAFRTCESPDFLQPRGGHLSNIGGSLRDRKALVRLWEAARTGPKLDSMIGLARIECQDIHSQTSRRFDN